jgi:hypothetical protein
MRAVELSKHNPYVLLGYLRKAGFILNHINYQRWLRLTPFESFREYPERAINADRGEQIWNRVLELLAAHEQREEAATCRSAWAPLRLPFMVQDNTVSPVLVLCHWSQRRAMLSTPPSAALMKYGCLPSGIVINSK